MVDAQHGQRPRGAGSSGYQLLAREELGAFRGHQGLLATLCGSCVLPPQ